VFNQLRHSLKKGSTAKGTSGVARGGVESRSRQTQEGVLDERTRLILFKMINKGTLFSEVGGVVKTGKESNVYYAPGVGGEGGREGGVVDLTREEESEEEEEEGEEEGRERGKGREEEAEAGSVSAASLASSSSSSFRSSSRTRGREGGDCAIKVFKTTLNEFSNRALYIDGDPRFGKLLFNKVREGGEEGGRKGRRVRACAASIFPGRRTRRFQSQQNTRINHLIHISPSLPPSPPPSNPLAPNFSSGRRRKRGTSCECTRPASRAQSLSNKRNTS